MLGPTSCPSAGEILAKFSVEYAEDPPKTCAVFKFKFKFSP